MPIMAVPHEFSRQLIMTDIDASAVSALVEGRKCVVAVGA
jgi:hypothetical protein